MMITKNIIQKNKQLSELAQELIEKLNDQELKDAYLKRLQEINDIDESVLADDALSVIKNVCGYYGLQTDKLKDSEEARGVATYLVHEYTDISLKNIADLLKYESYTDALHAIMDVKEKIASDNSFLQKIKDISDNFDNNQ